MVVGVLSLAPCYVGKSRYVELIRLHILVNCMELRWRQPCSDPVAPCFIKRREERKRKKEKFYIYLDVTHTQSQVFSQWHQWHGAGSPNLFLSLIALIGYKPRSPLQPEHWTQPTSDIEAGLMLVNHGLLCK